MNTIFKNSGERKLREKQRYVSPEIIVIRVELEHSIAAGSGPVQVSPGNSTNEVFEQWEVDVDDERTLEW